MSEREYVLAKAFDPLRWKAAAKSTKEALRTRGAAVALGQHADPAYWERRAAGEAKIAAHASNPWANRQLGQMEGMASAHRGIANVAQGASESADKLEVEAKRIRRSAYKRTGAAAAGVGTAGTGGLVALHRKKGQ